MSQKVATELDHATLKYISFGHSKTKIKVQSILFTELSLLTAVNKQYSKDLPVKLKVAKYHIYTDK